MTSGSLVGAVVSLIGTVLVELVPEEKLGRVASLDFFGSFGLMPLGYALTAVVSHALSPVVILAGGFGVALGAWTLPLASRRVRSAA